MSNNTEYNLQIPLGMNAVTDSPIFIDLANDPNTLIMGNVGAGKTTLINNIYQHCQDNADKWISVLFQDQSNFDSIYQVLETTRGEMKRRYADDELEDHKPFLLIVEDITRLQPNESESENFELLDTLHSIVHLGPKVNIYTIITSQSFERFSASSKKNKSIIDQCSNRIVMGTVKGSNYTSNLLGESVYEIPQEIPLGMGFLFQLPVIDEEIPEIFKVDATEQLMKKLFDK